MTPKVRDDKATAEWVVNTCLLFGTTVQMAHTIAGIFIDGLERQAQQAKKVKR